MSRDLLTIRRLGVRVTAAAAILAAVMLVCCLVGPHSISLKAVWGGFGSGGEVNSDYEIFVHVRVPRVILACIVGAALASAGVVFQGLLRNPLADPYILGISSGAGLGTMLAVVCGFGWTFWGRSPVAVCAFAGALATVWVVWFIGRLTGKRSVTGLLLTGVVVNAFLSAVIMFLTAVAKSEQVQSTIFWLMGNMTEESSAVLWFGGGFVLTGVIILFLLAADLNVISFGDVEAASIGIDIHRVRQISFAVAALITAIAVSLSGLVGFVGLVVPHCIRLMYGPDHRQLVPLSAIAGAMFLVAADTVARTIVAPAQLPVGVITALIGGPFFLVLLVRQSRRIGWLGK